MVDPVDGRQDRVTERKVVGLRGEDGVQGRGGNVGQAFKGEITSFNLRLWTSIVSMTGTKLR